MKIFSFKRAVQTNEILNFSEKNADDGKLESSTHITDSKEVDLSLKEDPLNIYRIASNETVLVSKVPALIHRKILQFL